MEYYKETFDINSEKNQNINKYFKLTKEQIFNEMEMFIDSNILDSYYTTKLYNDICKNKDKEVNNIIEDITMKDDFIIKKLTDIKTRVVLLESFNDSFQTKLVDNIITVNNFPVENMDKMLVNYNHAFRYRG